MGLFILGRRVRFRLHRNRINSLWRVYSFANRGNELYFTKQLTNEIYVSWDLGENWESFDLVDGTLASENPQFNGDEVLYTTQKTVGTIFRYRV